MDHATSRAAMDLVTTRGFPSAVCGRDGSLEDAILMVRWEVSTRRDAVTVNGGRAVDADLAPETRRCLDDYLALAKASFPAPPGVVELDVLYEVPLPATPPNDD